MSDPRAMVPKLAQEVADRARELDTAIDGPSGRAVVHALIHLERSIAQLELVAVLADYATEDVESSDEYVSGKRAIASARRALNL